MEYLISSINRIAFSIGNIDVAWYGLIIVFGMLLGLCYLIWQGKQINLNSDDAIEFFLWVIPLAVVCGRLLYVFVRPDEYFVSEEWQADFWGAFKNMIAIWDGGITIIGGILGGIVGLSIFAYRMRKKANYGQVLDLIVVPLLVGQVVGRIGNFINQEAFGKPASMLGIPEYFPFSVYIESPSGVEAEYHDLVYDNVPGWFAATFFYEMVWNAIGAVFCFVVWRKNKKYPGILGIFYFFWYFLGRLWLEQLRIDAVPITTIACAILFPAALIIGIVYILAKNNKLSFAKVNDAFKAGTLDQTSLTAMDVKNYLFATKWLQKSGVVAWKFYKVDSLIVVEKDELTKHIKPKESKKKVA